MMRYTQPIFFFCCLAFSGFLLAQNNQQYLIDFNQQRINHQRRAMTVLGGWAIGNIALGAALSSRHSGPEKHFHQMNAYWNVVNLGIAGLGYLAAAKEDPTLLDFYQTNSKHFSFQKVLLFNAGLDIGYVLGGFYLKERARRGGEHADRLQGFGNAVILQGGFLFAFDLLNVLISDRYGQQLELIMENQFGPGIGIRYQF